MRVFFLSACLLFAAGAAQAAEISLLMPGLTGTGVGVLAEQWKTKTGNSVVLPVGQPTVGKVDQAVASGMVADLVISPPSEFPGMAGKLRPGSEKKVGRVIFGVAVKSGTPHPDISTMEKFRAALKGKRVAYNDPAIGSLAGKMVDAMLKGPDYADVIRVPAHTTGGQAVAEGLADLTIAVESEELKVKGIDIVGPVPDATGLSIDISGAVLATATHPQEAASFLDYLVSPEAEPILRPIGIAPP